MIRRSLIVLVILSLAAVPMFAAHAWGSYHWARKANPFTVKVVDSNTPDWDDNLRQAINDWSRSSVLDAVVEAGVDDSRTRKRCPMVSGKVRSCNAAYGMNGWLGLASINISGNHITQGTSKMNDSYLATSGYNETNRQHVMCQEIGHDWGLGHQDESGKDLNTCMDYANALDNPAPNAHDYSQLEAIYAHVDSTTTVASIWDVMLDSATRPSTIEEIMAGADQWGTPIAFDAKGRPNVFVMPIGVNHEGEHGYNLTHVFWADKETDERGPQERTEE
jgi:hypothetical protein